MLKAPKRDIFRFSDGREVAIDALPAGLIFDVLVMPGREHLSAVLKKGGAEIVVSEGTSGRKSLLERVLQVF